MFKNEYIFLLQQNQLNEMKKIQVKIHQVEKCIFQVKIHQVNFFLYTVKTSHIDHFTL